MHLPDHELQCCKAVTHELAIVSIEEVAVAGFCVEILPSGRCDEIADRGDDSADPIG